jgi:hypothetical protein
MRQLTCAAVLLAALAVGVLRPAVAAKGPVALLPASVTKGAPENGRVFTDALRASLEKQGYTVIPEARVTQAMKNLGLDGSRIIPAASLGKLRDNLEASHVVYPRVLGIGKGTVSGQQQATLLVNVMGKASAVFVHTKQVAQVFEPDGAPDDPPVMHRPDAEAAVEKLMQAFYEKNK